MIIRELNKKDICNGFLHTLDSLRPTSNIDDIKSQRIFEKIDSNPDHIIMVAELDKKIVGAATLFIETKFIHDGGQVGHIEDVVVQKNSQSSGIGKKIIIELLKISRERGCYKTVLDCTADVQEFYEKLGFKKTAGHFRIDNF